MLTVEAATRIVRRHVEESLTVTAIRPLTGGMVNTVVELLTDGEPASLVAKVSEEPDHGGFRWEYDSLRYFRERTTFPVPRPYACLDGDEAFAGKCLLMAKVPGKHLGQVRLTAGGMARLQRQMADLVADLHEHRRDTYGPAWQPGGPTRWLDRFGPQIASEFEAVADRLRPVSRRTIARLLADLGDWLPEFGQPTLVHGDLWATNIMADDTDGEAPRITAFLDGGARFTEVEYELAYLRVFHTADASFFEHYATRHAIRDGFDSRCRVYWLNTMLLHVRVFGADYLPPCERLADELAKLGA